MIRGLGYVVIHTPKPKEWHQLASKLIGLDAEVCQLSGILTIRMDDYAQRLLIIPTQERPTLTLGFEIEDETAFHLLITKIETNGFTVHQGTEQEAALRQTAEMAYFYDPDNNRIELAWGMEKALHPLRPGRSIGGFRTGDLGIGHVALGTLNNAAMRELYRNVLGFKLSDHGNTLFPIEFYHINPRHHTVALADTGAGASVHHLMLEYNCWDDVGRAYDIALENPESIGVSLGRHINDHVTSFYLYTPDGWMLELGWAGRLIDQDWVVEDLQGLSLWGMTVAGYLRTSVFKQDKYYKTSQIRAYVLQSPYPLPITTL